MASRSGSGSDGERCSRSCSSGLSGWRKCQCRLGGCGNDLSVADLSDIWQSTDPERSVYQHEKWVDYVTNHTTTPCLWTGGEHFGDWLGLMHRREAIRIKQRRFYRFSILCIFDRTCGKGRACDREDVTAYEVLHENIVETFETLIRSTGHRRNIFWRCSSDWRRTVRKQQMHWHK